MATDLVIGIDSSTTATKAIAWDPHGRAVAEERAPVAMRSPRPGWFEQSVEDWWSSLREALGELLGRVEARRIAALAIANQRETVGFLDEDGRELRPAILWLDERCREEVGLLAERIGIARFRAITGKTPDPTPAVFSLYWMKRHEPANWARLGRVVDVHGHLVLRLTGVAATSWASADPHGLLDLRSMRYSPEILEALGLSPERLLPPVPPGSLLGEVTPEAARETGLPAGLPVFAGGGDGQAAGLGVGVTGPGRAYLNLGTAAVSGIHAETFAADPAFRTLTALDGRGYVFELCLRTGSFLTDWMVSRIFGFDPARDPGCYDRLEAEARRVPAGSGGLLLLPYWSGAMPPWWDPDARGAVIGLAAEHGRGHLYRALMEAVALDMAMGYEAVERTTGTPIEEILVIGGGARSPLWRQILADATGRPIRLSATIEATCLGAAMLAAAGVGWYAGPAEAAAAMGGAIAGEEHPRPEGREVYAKMLALYREAYPALRGLYARLAAFRRAGR